MLKEVKEMNRSDFDLLLINKILIKLSGDSLFQMERQQCVLLLSSYHGSETTALSLQDWDGSRKGVMASIVVSGYILSMGGVDKTEMLHSTGVKSQSGTDCFCNARDSMSMHLKFTKKFIQNSRSWIIEGNW